MLYAADAVDFQLENQREILDKHIGGYRQYKLQEPFCPTFISRNLCDMLGYAREELFCEGTDLYAAVVYPADRPVYESLLVRLSSGERAGTADYRIVRKDGSVLYVRDSMTAERREDGTLVGHSVLTDITQTKPRELMTGDESGRLTPVTELLIDTGLTKEEAEKAAPIGTPVGFEPVYTELAGGFFAGKGFDNKCSAAAVILAVSQLEMSALECDLYVSLSAREEVGHRAVSTAAFRIRPDAALVLDVTFGYAPEGKKPGDSEMQGGPAVSISAILDKALTDFVVETAEIEKIPVQTVVEATGTGTHADELVYAAGGIPTALIGIPIWFMHTANEILNLEDVEHTARLIAAVIRRRYGRGVDGKE